MFDRQIEKKRGGQKKLPPPFFFWYVRLSKSFLYTPKGDRETDSQREKEIEISHETLPTYLPTTLSIERPTKKHSLVVPRFS